jgi:uncharacterized integral membrane protein (TIGR00698 family)
MLFALLIGMAFHWLHEEGRCILGIEFASREVLRVGVALLGVRITTAQITTLGFVPVCTVIVGVITTIFVGILLARRLGLTPVFGVLTGSAVAICGASAALAIATVLPRRPGAERDTILVVVAVTALSTLAMIFYPIAAAALGLDSAHAGVFLGGTIHDIAQVIGAGYTISPQAGDIATYVKLLRVSMLAPVVLAVSAWNSRTRESNATELDAGISAPGVPAFLLVFIGLVVWNSISPLPATVIADASDASRAFLVTAIAALGMKTSLRDLVKVGWQPIVLLVSETVWIGVLVLGAVRWLM